MNNLKKEVNELIQNKKDKRDEERFNRIVEYFDSALSKGIKINDSITISNFKEFAEYLSFEFPESFNINNPEEIAKHIVIPEQKDFPKSFAISNAHDIAKHIRIPEQKEFPTEFKISNFPEKEKLPENLSKLSFIKTESILSDIFNRIGVFAKEFKNVFSVSNRKPSEAIPVKIVEDGSFVNSQKFKFNSEGALIVEPTRVGQSGGGGLTRGESETLKSIAGLSVPAHDEIQATYPDTVTSVYTYKKDGATVGVITVTYTTADKDVLVSVVKS